jgi:hypothetical protein
MYEIYEIYEIINQSLFAFLDQLYLLEVCIGSANLTHIVIYDTNVVKCSCI